MDEVAEEVRALPGGTVTFLLTDIEGSSRLWDAGSVEAAHAVARHRELLAGAIERNGGARPVEQGEGDSVVAVFPRATDAVTCACEAQRALGSERWPGDREVRVRMAVHTGDAVPAPDGTYSGAVLNRCARLRSLAHGGQTVVSNATHDVVVDHLGGEMDLRDLGLHRLRDLSRPERVWQLIAPGTIGEFPPLRSLDSAPNNLPVQLSSFVGRGDDIDLCVALAGESRLLTLTGSGGCGKTRLALRVAAEVSDGFGDGVWWVELAPVADGAMVPNAVMAAMGERIPFGREPLHAALDHIATRQALIVLDNCEHIVGDAAAFVDKLLRGSPDAKVLATSREPLAVEGEITWRVPSLAMPPSVATEPEALGQYDAVRLFIERAVQVRPDFVVTNANAPAVAEICHRLDGIPLAIELAAARTRVLSAEHIAAELDDRFHVLGGGVRTALPRQQTLLASVDWSHDLLSAPEQALLRRLGVFAGGFTLDAAERVAAVPPLGSIEVLELLGQLVSKSLVQVDESRAGGGSERYRLLETIRQYALDRLEDAGEREGARDRHLAWAVELAQSLEPRTANAQADALAHLDTDAANLRIALEWAAAAEDGDDLLRLVAALGFHWVNRGHFAAAQRWTSALPDTSEDTKRALVARARSMAAYIAFFNYDPTTSHRLASVALAEARDCEDRPTEARCLHTLAMSLVLTDPAASRSLATEAVAVARETGDLWCEAESLAIVSNAYVVEGRSAESEALIQQLVPLVEAADNDTQRAFVAIYRGLIAMCRAQFDEADAQLWTAIETARGMGAPAAELWACGSLMTSALIAGRAEAASRLPGMTVQAREWGLLGDFMLPGIVAVSEFAITPAATATSMAPLAEALFSLGDVVEGSTVAMIAALAILESDDAEGAERLATRALGDASRAGVYCVPGLELLCGRVAMLRGEHAAAEEHAHAALAFQTERAMQTWLADTLELLGRAATAIGSIPEGVRLVAAGDAFRLGIDQRRLPSAQREIDANLDIARSALGDAFDPTWAEGHALELHEAIAYARRARGERRRPSFGWASLTPTELKVIHLTAQGLTNPEIGERLFITRGTVKTHLAHVFAKLGINSRAEVAAEAARQQLTDG